MNDKNFTQEIIDFINSNKSENLRLEFQPLHIYETIIKNCGYELFDGELYGQDDFCFTFIKGSQILYLKGSLWYGNIMLVKETEDEQ